MLARLEPTIRTVEVVQFCSWSAWRIRIRFRAWTTSGVATYSSYGIENIMCRKLAT